MMRGTLEVCYDLLVDGLTTFLLPEDKGDRLVKEKLMVRVDYPLNEGPAYRFTSRGLNILENEVCLS